MTNPLGDNPDEAAFNDEARHVRRSYIALAFAAVLAIVLLWAVKALKESNRIVACETSGHHNCVPLDTSVRGAPR